MFFIKCFFGFFLNFNSKMIKIILCLIFIILLPNLVFTQTEIDILYTSNTNGALENCRCPNKALGSLEKRKYFIDEWYNNKPNTLFLDSGDFLSAKKNEFKDSIAFKIYEMLPYDAIGIGDQEFYNGINFITNLIDNSTLPFISLNISIPKFKNVNDYIILNKKNINFGIISIVDPDIFKFYPKRIRNNVEVFDFNVKLDDQIKFLKNKVDIIILLSHIGIEKDRDLAKKNNQIDIIIGGHSQSFLEKPEKINNTIVVHSGKDGYNVGHLKIKLNKKNKIYKFNGELIPMTLDMKSDSTVLEMIKNYHTLNQKKDIKLKND